jgi:hypothetical protein
MIYFIIGYIGVFALLILLYYRYNEFRVKSANDIITVSAKNELELNSLRESNNKYLQDMRAQLEKMNELLREVEELRKEKENESKLRLTTEKQVELAMQKTKDVEKRIEDWHDAQTAIMDDSIDTMLKIGNDLFKKMNESYKKENQDMRNLIGRMTQDVAVAVQKISQNYPSSSTKGGNVNEVFLPQDKLLQQEVEKVVELSHSLALVAGKNYFTAKNFDAKSLPLMLCEFALIKDRDYYLVDFKALRYFSEYEKVSKNDQKLALDTLKQRLDKYFVYLTNPKYLQSLQKILPDKNLAKKQAHLTIFVQGAQIEIIKKLGYLEKARNLQIKVLDTNSINDILL